MHTVYTKAETGNVWDTSLILEQAKTSDKTLYSQLSNARMTDEILEEEMEGPHDA